MHREMMDVKNAENIEHQNSLGRQDAAKTDNMNSRSTKRSHDGQDVINGIQDFSKHQRLDLSRSIRINCNPLLNKNKLSDDTEKTPLSAQSSTSTLPLSSNSPSGVDIPEDSLDENFLLSSTLRISPQPSNSRISPEPSTSRVSPEPSTSRVSPQPSTSRVSPQPSTSRVSPQPSTSKDDAATTSFTVSSNYHEVESVAYMFPDIDKDYLLLCWWCLPQQNSVALIEYILSENVENSYPKIDEDADKEILCDNKTSFWDRLVHFQNQVSSDPSFLDRERKKFGLDKLHDDGIFASAVTGGKIHSSVPSIVAESNAVAAKNSDSEEIECCCCFSDTLITKVVQCSDGHLACHDCIVKYVKEVTFGTLDIKLKCLAGDCDAKYLKSHLVDALPTALKSQFEDKEADLSVLQADFKGLVRCSQCQCPSIVPEESKVLICPKCGYEACKLCGLMWEIHCGLPCDEFVTSEDQLRKSYEEKMSQICLRFCGRCNASILRVDGCDFVRCTCGYSMCYNCRLPLNDNKETQYHSQQIEACNAVRLSENGEIQKIKELQKEALRLSELSGFSNSKIGAKAVDIEEDANKRRSWLTSGHQNFPGPYSDAENDDELDEAFDREEDFE